MDLAPSDFCVSYLEKALVRTLFHLRRKHQMCYHQAVDMTGTLIFPSRMDKFFPHCDKCLSVNRTILKKSVPVTHTFFYCQFSPLKCCLLFMGNVNLVSDPLTYIPTELWGHMKISYQVLSFSSCKEFGLLHEQYLRTPHKQKLHRFKMYEGEGTILVQSLPHHLTHQWNNKPQSP